MRPWGFVKSKTFLRTLSILALLFPLCIALYRLKVGSIPFWYDPARDFLSAWDNLTKLTLIGPTSGIPGIFYGPYWIWFLSLALLISKDPRIPILIVLVLPILVVIPVLLTRLKDYSKGLILCLWLLFTYSYGLNDAVMPWNPNLAPFFLFLIFMLFHSLPLRGKNIRDYGKYVLLGIFTGLLLNVHISFGLVTILGLFLYLLIEGVLVLLREKHQLKDAKVQLLLLLAFGGGVGITGVPFLLFELRHGFNQINAALSVLTAGHAVVGVTGLSKQLIFFEFLSRLEHLLFLPRPIVIVTIAVALGLAMWGIKHKTIVFTSVEKRILLLLSTISLSLFSIYLLSKNPVWSYHFIAVEVLFFFLLLVIINKLPLLKTLIIIWTLCLTVWQVVNFIQETQQDPLRLTSLASKELQTRTIKDDAGKREYVVFPYSPSIYVYDYTYLFRYLAKKEVPFDPSNNGNDAKLAYVLVRSLSDPKDQDFLEFRTPAKDYKTTRTWQLKDGTIILRRERVR